MEVRKLHPSHQAAYSVLKQSPTSWYGYDDVRSQVEFAIKSVMDALRELDQWGLVERRTDPTNGRKAQYRTRTVDYPCQSDRSNFRNRLERCVHRLEVHNEANYKIPLAPGEFVRLVANRGVLGTADELGWSIRKTTRVAGIYGLGDYVSGVENGPVEYDIAACGCGERGAMAHE